MGKWLSEDITQLILRLNIKSDNLLLYHEITNKMTVHLDMLCALMKHWVASDENY